MSRSPTSASAVLDFQDLAVAARGRACFKDPLDVIVARTPDEVRPALRAVERASAHGLYAVGYVAYEAAPAFDRAFVVRKFSGPPLLWFAIFERPSTALHTSARGAFNLSGWTPSVSRDEYRRRVETVREAIARGDTYQVNYTMRLRAGFEGDDFALYERLRRAQPTRYGAYLDTGRFRILSISPELFFRRRGRRITARPMKGTNARGRWAEEDEEQARWLAASEKNRAENVMILDLLRNDVGRVAEFGSVRASRLFQVERYPTVFQMTSTVSATLRARVTLEEVFAALFPCGSVTGAPKISTMRLIAELEESPRGVYCGAVGVVAPGGDAVFNVAIRTLVVDAETCVAEYGVGGGITWDSTAEGEYAEALTKARALSDEGPAFELLETMRLEGFEYDLLEAHLARLASSARYFGIRLYLPRVREALAEHAGRHTSREPRRVRLLVARDGSARVESEPLQPALMRPAAVALARTPVSRRERFLYHKTTRREVYDARRAERPNLFDVLLWNEEGELTEFTNGNLVVELDGERLTPPRDCGLLAGTFRAGLVARGEVSERVLMREDLERASRCWLVNSVRGWVEVSFVGDATAESAGVQ